MNIEWVHFPLHPETPPEGRSLDDLFRGRNVDRKAMHAQMKARMDAEGLPYGERSMTYNSRLAQELGKWADTQPGGETVHDALFRAYFVDARDISRPEVLLAVRSAADVRRRLDALDGGGTLPDALRRLLEVLLDPDPDRRVASTRAVVERLADIEEALRHARPVAASTRWWSSSPPRPGRCSSA